MLRRPGQRLTSLSHSQADQYQVPELRKRRGVLVVDRMGTVGRWLGTVAQGPGTVRCRTTGPQSGERR